MDATTVGSRYRMIVVAVVVALALTIAAVAVVQGRDKTHRKADYTETFNLNACDWTASGQNLYMSLVPGTTHLLEGEEDGETITTEQVVTDETEVVDGVTTRVIEERHTVDGELDEISRNFYAICAQNGSVFYFGETVDFYENGQVVGHEGAWRAGENGARPGLYMPALPLLGARYYQEIAPGAALDRAEVTSLNASADVSAGAFSGCLETVETSPLEPHATDIKIFCPNVGIIVDGMQELVSYDLPAAAD